MIISDYLSRFSISNNETESIPFLTKRNNLTGNLYFNEIFSEGHDQVSDYLEEQDAHSCPATRSQTKAQNISLPALFPVIPVTNPIAETTKTDDIGASADRSAGSSVIQAKLFILSGEAGAAK